MGNVMKGLLNLLGSKKGALSLIIIACITGLAAFGKLESMAYAAVVASVQAIYCYTAARTDRAYLEAGQPTPEMMAAASEAPR